MKYLPKVHIEEALKNEEKMKHDKVVVNEDNLFFIDAPGEYGKNFTALIIANNFGLQNVQFVASTGVPADNLPTSKTALSYFELPVDDITGQSMS